MYRPLDTASSISNWSACERALDVGEDSRDDGQISAGRVASAKCNSERRDEYEAAVSLASMFEVEPDDDGDSGGGG